MAKKETPLMKQYNAIKAKYPEALLLFRVGDFYETFAEDAVKALLAGADAVMAASSLLQNGIDHLTTMKTELAEWMEEHEYHSVEQLKGSMSINHCSNPEGLKRANYMKALTSYSSALP